LRKENYSGEISLSDIPVVILCGGKGTRMGCENTPKPMFKIGSKPILWHIMKIYASFGIGKFILLLGYKKEKIKNYFLNHREWDIKFVDTGIDTNTGGRIKKAESFIESGVFFATYGDGLADINLSGLFEFYLRHKKTAVLTSVRPYSQFGIMSIDSHTNIITHFEEKPVLDHWVNGGFFVFGREIFSYIKENDILEKDTLKRLIGQKQLIAYKHTGFWECMDTYKDNLLLNELWKAGNAPWGFWLRKNTRRIPRAPGKETVFRPRAGR